MVRGPGGSRSELLDLELEAKYFTPDAVLVVNLKDQKIWLPRSQIEFEETPGSSMIQAVVPRWLAEDRELI